MKKEYFLNFPITISEYSQFVNKIIDLSKHKKSSVVCVANVHMFIEAYHCEKFLHIINDSEIITPDGRPLVWALELLKGIKQDRVTGMDLLPDLLSLMAKNNISAYFYGSTEDVLNKTKIFLSNKYPDLVLAGFHSPPFGDFQIRNEEKIIADINESAPCIVFVVLGCPKQEKWMAAMKDKINAVMIGVGGALPVMLGIQKRAPVWMQDKGLEWLYRLYQEPRRLIKRYSKTNSLFLWIFLKEYVNVKLIAPLKSIPILPAPGHRLTASTSKKSIVILGQNSMSKYLNRYLETKWKQFHITGIFADDINELTPYPVLGSINQFAAYATNHRVDAVYSLLPENTSKNIADIIRFSKNKFIKFNYVHPFGINENLINADLFSADKLFIESRKYPIENKFYKYGKRMVDILSSLFGIIFLLSWMIPLIGLVIKLNSRGPVFYTQRRSGTRNTIFSCIKFRTLRVNADANSKQVCKGDQRVTSVGNFLRKTNIDELPQLFNVLMGQMSLVGPRPHMLLHTREFSTKVEDFMVRHWLKPGITGWAQINGYRGEIHSDDEIRQRVHCDLWYLDNSNLLLDLKIIAKTCILTIKGDEMAY